MVNPTNSFGPELDPFNDARYLRVPMHELSDGTFVNASAGTPMPITFGNPLASDAFGRQRTSTPTTLFDSKQLFDNLPLFWDDQEVSGSGTSSVHSSDRASSIMSVSDSTAGKRVRQTFQRFNYQPGKSQLILQTANLAGVLGTGTQAAVGYFDDSNGVFWEYDSGVIYICVRSNTTGTPVTTRVPQSEWNGDKMDGTGPSGVTLDPTKSQILGTDFEWLGVGTVRFFFVVDEVFILAHEQHHANHAAGVYMSTPNLPLRYEIENDGTGNAASIEQICSTVISEGGLQPTGQFHYASTEGTKRNFNTAGTLYPLVGLRLKAAAISEVVDLDYGSVSLTTNDDFEWLIVFNPTVTGTDGAWSDRANSACQVYLNGADGTPDTATGGQIVSGGYGQGNSSISSGLENDLKLGSAIDGSVDEAYLCVRPLGSNADVYGGIGWRELS